MGDTLKKTLTQYMETAHDRLFSQNSKDKMAADDKAERARSAQEVAQDAVHRARLAQEVSNTEADGAAEELKVIMGKISEKSADHNQLNMYSQKVLSLKSKVMSSRAKAIAAAQKTSEMEKNLEQLKTVAAQKEQNAKQEEEKVANDKPDDEPDANA